VVMMGYYAVSCLTVQPPLLSQGCAVLNKKVRTRAQCSSAVPGMRLKGRGVPMTPYPAEVLIAKMLHSYTVFDNGYSSSTTGLIDYLPHHNSYLDLFHA